MQITGLNDGGCLASLPLRTDRLRLRPVAFADAETITDMAGDAEVARTTSHIPHPYDLGMAKAWIAKVSQQTNSGELIALAIEDNESYDLIGVISLHLDGGRSAGELGFWIGRPYWGRGYASEAADAMVKFAFERLRLARVIAAAMPENTASVRIQENAGMVPCGQRVDEHNARGRTLVLEVRELTAAAYQALCVERRQILLVVAVALVDADGRVLLARRPEGKAMAGLWEFPGGKVHPGETPELALVRELQEELGIDITESCLAPFTFASHTYGDFHLMMPLYICRQWKGTVTPREGQILNWVRPSRMHRLPMPPADVPLVAMLRDLL
ncbi:MAG: GNAT family N-acetyltransferase [Hyphomicrobiales bacterium]|nr:GNAT family N-acetyltransferase [Hyphomicrobiales bacterium]